MATGLPKIGQASVHYERRQPENTILYQLVQNHIETFYTQVEKETEYFLCAVEMDWFALNISSR